MFGFLSVIVFQKNVIISEQFNTLIQTFHLVIKYNKVTIMRI
jgi:hypothetical protein